MNACVKRSLYFAKIKGYTFLLFVAIYNSSLVACGDEPVCPISCICDFGQLIVNCSSMGLFDVPLEDVENSFNWTESLDFSGNFLDEINAETLTSFTGLLDLSLANNHLQDIANGSFYPLVERLHRLILSDNELVRVPPAIRELRALRELDLSRNRLWFLGSDSFTGLGMLKTLCLDQNSIHVFDGAAFHGLTSLHKLSMIENILDEDPVGWFTYSPLRELYLSHNALPLASGVRLWFGSNVTASLEYLVLNNNGIRSLSGNKFWGMVNLHKLDLGGNHIQILTEESMEGLFNLNELIINANSLEYIDVRSFQGMSDLQTLTIDENHLLSLPKGLFSQTKRLTSLNVARNKLQDISAITEEHLPELTELYLFSNSIQDIGDHGFTKLPMLSQLIAGGNQFTQIPNVTNLPGLEKLELSQNQIHSVSHIAFQGSPSIREIYLEQNQLEGLDYEPFAELYELERLTLFSNLWFCDCRIEWMQDAMYAEYPPAWMNDIIDGVFCENPPELRSFKLVDITQDDLVLRCPAIPDRNVILVLLISWFGLVFLFASRYWFRKMSKDHRWKKVGRRNTTYQKRLTRNRRNGLVSDRISGYVFGLSESHFLILQNGDNDEQDRGRSNKDNGDLSREQIEIARVTTV